MFFNSFIGIICGISSKIGLFKHILCLNSPKIYILNQYLEFITTTEINQKIINEYIHYLNKKFLKYKTIKRKIASVKAFYSYLEYEEIIDYSPFNKIKTKIKI